MSSRTELSGESFAEERLGRVVRRNITVPLPRPVKCSGTFYLLLSYLVKVRVSNEITHKRKTMYKIGYWGFPVYIEISHTGSYLIPSSTAVW